MIIHQQLLTGRASRVLVLVPPSLLHQWLVEMLRRFNLGFAVFDQARVEAAGAANPFLTEQRVLCSLEFLVSASTVARAALEGDWDLLVIDEISMVRCDLLDAVDVVDATGVYGASVLATIGDLLEDVAVRIEGPIRLASDTDALATVADIVPGEGVDVLLAAGEPMPAPRTGDR